MRLIAVAMTVLLLAACSHIPGYYRVPILQGNTVTTAKLDKLEIGMTPRQVEYLLGTAMVKDNFSGNHWAYVLYYRNSHGQSRETLLNLYFENGKLARIGGSAQYERMFSGKDTTTKPDASAKNANVNS